MERARWKIRMFVMIVVLAAFIVGAIYYIQFLKTTEITEGVLISIMSESREGLDGNGTE